jgi:hypothetical protein
MNGAGKSSLAEAIHRYADEVVDEYAHDDLVTLAREIEEDVGFYDEGADTARSIAAELRRRAAAGVRKWPRLTD